MRFGCQRDVLQTSERISVIYDTNRWPHIQKSTSLSQTKSTIDRTTPLTKKPHTNMHTEERKKINIE